ncbi:hypothetical protein DL771_003610 [Monosporascus sp. 5C6A]|nr:hypothetical protein DL771_003610 [Monosporascus sp. 5C6A]
MPPADKAKSIFEILTAENPKIDYPPPKSKTQSSRREWYKPKQIVEWNEFSYATLEGIYGGALFREARSEDYPLPHYPHIVSEADCVVEDEPSTVHIMTKWNHTIVAAALDVIKHQFYPCIWIPGKRGSIQGIKNKQSPATYKPSQDSGAVHSSCASGVSSSSSLPVQMLPKDYKTASKWKSEQALSPNLLLDQNGLWIRGAQKSIEAQPLKQVYTYCVNYECRYVLADSLPPGSNGESSSSAELKKALIRDGLMEYASIPWTNDSKGDPKNYEGLTVNLALWFIHVLAGNGHRVDWEYEELQSEQLVRQPYATPSTTQVAGDEFGESDSDQSEGHLLKRIRTERDDDDPIHMSFYSTQLFASQVFPSFKQRDFVIPC